MNLAEIDAIVLNAFGNTIAAHGKSKWRQGKAVPIKTEIDPSGQMTWVDGLIQGRQRLPYECTLAFPSRSPETMKGTCSCELAKCGHSAALAYAWLYQQRRQSPAQVEDWLQSLRQISQAGQSLAEPSDKTQIRYILSDDEAQARLSLYRSYLTEDGYEEIQIVPVRILLDLYDLHSPVEREIARLLLGLADPTTAWIDSESLLLQGEAGNLALRQILASGRCFYQTPDGPVLIPGEARQLDFKWKKTSEGWQLQPQAEPAATSVFLAGKAWYFDKNLQSMGPIRSEIGPELLAQLLLAPPVPVSRLENVAMELIEALPNVELPLPEGIRIELEVISEVEPSPVLTLRGMPRPDRDPLYIAELGFEYDEIFMLPSSEAESLRVEHEGVFYQLQRDLAAEAAWRGKLPETGLQALGDGISFVLPGDSGHAQAQAWEAWLSDAYPALEDQGWTIHVGSDFGLSVYTGGDEWEASIDTGEQEGWFDISLGFVHDGQTLNLMPMLLNLLTQFQDPKELQALLARKDSLLLPVGTEQWIRVPSERLKGILATLIELYDNDAIASDGKLSLSWYQSLSIDGLLNTPGLRWQGANRVRELNARLKGFEGIAKVPVPRSFKATLRPYQKEGLNWLQFLREFGFHGVLADDMGLGKTIMTLAHLQIEKKHGRADKPSLVVAPTSVVPNWRREAEKFAPDLKVLVIQGPERETALASMQAYDLVLTTYTLLRIDLEHYLGQRFHVLILDEAQAIKNPLAKTAKAVCQLEARHRLALSGTPMENHLNELWSIYRFLMPGFLGSQERFTRLYRTPIEKYADRGRADALRSRIKPFLLRRRKIEVEKDLPPKSEILQYIELSAGQRDLYETIRVSMDARVRAEIKQKGLKRSQMMILEALLKLRQVCCDPALLQLEQAQSTQESAKLEWLLETVPEMVEEGRRILIFSQFVSMLDLIEEGLRKQKIKPLRLTGATQKREEVVEAFQAGQAPVFLISLKAGGVGINLTTADTVIHYDPWWNPAAENQATDRAWRIGQDKPVFVYKLIAEHTVEEKILALQQKKASLSEGIFSELDEGGLRLAAEELLALLED